MWSSGPITLTLSKGLKFLSFEVTENSSRDFSLQDRWSPLGSALPRPAVEINSG